MTETRNLFEQLYHYSRSDYYPYHMPGHKRRQLGKMDQSILDIDITEIDGFDNLHQPEEILLDLQNQANNLYGAEETFYLVNGSTCGILSAISAALPEGGHLLMARGCHKSAYHAAYLRNLQITYLYAEQAEDWTFSEAITAAQVERALEAEPTIGAVLIVSPTYEGRIADIAAIARVVHRKRIPLIVDEAHGAHLGFAKGFAESSCRQGADVVIHSVHKTLPAMTQTALLHRNGDLIDGERLKKFLRIYQSSSPSYVLMASISDAMEILKEKGAGLLGAFWNNYRRMLEQLGQCKQLRFVPFQEVEAGRQDVGKLVISTAHAGVSGQWLFDVLRDQYHLQCEMSADKYCLAMFTMADTPQAYERMTTALLEVDRRLEERTKCQSGEDEETVEVRLTESELGYNPPERIYSLTKAWDLPWELTDMSECAGKIAADFINLYPPGIPLLIPGEQITAQMREVLCFYHRMHLKIQGINEQNHKLLIRTIKENI